MSQSPLPLDTATTATAAGDFAHLPLERVWADPDQPRRTFDEAFLAQLSESIKTQGVIQPIVVRPTSASEVTYTIISGESRWRASQMAGKDSIPALIRRDLSEGDIAVMQILENLQRRDLTLIETCEGVTRLVKEIGLDKAAEQLGMSKSWVSRHSTLAELPPEVLELVKAGKVESIEVAKDLGQLVQLDKKAGAIAVGRLAGTHAYYGQPIHNAPTAEQLDQLSPEEREKEQNRLEELSRPITRAEIRVQLGQARHAENMKQRAAAERKAKKDDPEVAKEREAEKAKAAKEKADNERRKAFKQQAEAFEQTHTNALCQALGLKAPKRHSYGWDHDTPAVVRCQQHFGSHGSGGVPAKFDTLKFCLDFNDVDVALLKKIKAAGFTSKVKMNIEWDLRITVEQAEAIAKILGEKDVGFHTEIEAKAGEVPAFIARFEKTTNLKTAALDGAMALNDFIATRVKKKPDARVKAAVLYEAYEKHCKAIKTQPLPFTSNEYGAVIEANDIEKKRFTEGVHYLHIEVKA